MIGLIAYSCIITIGYGMRLPCSFKRKFEKLKSLIINLKTDGIPIVNFCLHELSILKIID